MNERIQELAEQAGLRFTQLMSNPMVPVVDGKETDLEKFAELIVKECISINRQRMFSDYEGDSLRVAHNNALLCANSDMFEHFGVEDRAIPILSADEQALFAGIASSKLFTIEGAKKQFGVEE